MTAILSVRFRRQLVWLLAVLSGLAVMVWFFIPVRPAAEQLVRGYFAQHGVKVGAFSIDSLGLTGMTLGKLALGEQDEITIEKTEIAYLPQKLLRGQIRSIALEGVTLKPVLANGAVTLPSLTALMGESKADASPAPLVIPLEQFSIKRLMLEVPVSPKETYTVSAGEVALEAAVQPEGAHAAFHINDLALVMLAPPVIPLSLKGEFDIRGMEVSAKGSIADALARLKADFTVQHSLEKQKGEANLNLAPVAFASTGVQPIQLFPIVKDILGPTDGKVGLQGRLTWAADKKMTQGLVVTFDKLSTLIQGIGIGGINGTVRFNGLAPPSTPAPQEIHVDLLQLGVPLTRGEVKFALTPSGLLSIAPTEWHWADGVLTTQAVRLDMNHPKLEEITLGARDIKLETLVSLVLKENFSATGTLSGTLPIRIKDGAILVEKGRLEAGSGGVIRYTPGSDSPLAAGNGQTEILTQALTDFHYRSASLAVHSESPKLLTVDLGIFGNNPALYGGKAVELHVHLQGDLVEMIQSSLNAYQLPETLQKQLMK